MSLQGLKDAMAKSAYGITKAEAHAKGICIDCKKPIDFLKLSDADFREYKISGVCPVCWDKMWQDD